MSLPAAHVAGTFAPLELIPVAVIAVLYAKRSSTLAAKGRPVPVWRQLCFAAGLLLIGATLFSPLGHISEELILAHMAEHLLLGDIASLLLVLGLTGPILQPVLAIRFFDRLRFFADPAFALPLWAANMVFWHIPVMYDAAYGGSPVHALEHASFLFFGAMMWMPVFGPLPTPAWFTAGWKVAYVIIVRLLGAAFGNFLMWSGTLLYKSYSAGQAYWGIDPITDQSTAGVIMMVEGTFLALGVLAWTFFEAAREGDEKQRLLDLARDRGVEIDAERVRRAVASGHGGRLERQLREAGRDAEREPA